MGEERWGERGGGREVVVRRRDEGEVGGEVGEGEGEAGEGEVGERGGGERWGRERWERRGGG